MSRNDGSLYTGATSRSFTAPKSDELQERRKAAKEKRLEAAHKLKPSAEVINTILDAEKAMVTQELANLPLNVTTTEENVKELLMAYQRHLRFIDHVRNRINTALKEQS